MSDGVGVYVFESDAFGIIFDDRPDAEAVHGAAEAGDEECFGGFVIAVEGGAEFGEVLVDGFDGGLAEGNKALFVAFAGDFGNADFMVVVVELEGADFAGAAATGVHEFEEGFIAPVHGFFGVWCVEEFFDFLMVDGFGEFFPCGRGLEEFGGVIVAVVVVVEEFAESTDGGHMSGD